jgi:hypothetical protein
MSLLCTIPDRILKTRTDPEARAELIKRGLLWEPGAAKRTKECRARADYRYERKFVR